MMRFTLHFSVPNYARISELLTNINSPRRLLGKYDLTHDIDGETKEQKQCDWPQVAQ